MTEDTDVRLAEVKFCDECPHCNDEKRPYCIKLARGIYEQQYQTGIHIPKDCPLPKKRIVTRIVDECEHDWKYIDSGMDYWGHYWQDRRCKKCGKKDTQWCD
jgi:hypothetical protein